MTGPSARLLSLGEEGLARAVAGEADRLAPLIDESGAVLRDTPAEELDREVLERVADINREVQRLIVEARDEVAVELGRLGRGRAGVGAYARSLDSSATQR